MVYGLETMAVTKKQVEEMEAAEMKIFRFAMGVTRKDTIVGSVIKWLKRRAYNQHGLDSKPTCTTLLCPLERHFTARSPAWWSGEAVLN